MKPIDVRKLTELVIEDTCFFCKKDYGIRLHIRHKCEGCRTEALRKIERDNSLVQIIKAFFWGK